MLLQYMGIHYVVQFDWTCLLDILNEKVIDYLL